MENENYAMEKVIALKADLPFPLVESCHREEVGLKYYNACITKLFKSLGRNIRMQKMCGNKLLLRACLCDCLSSILNPNPPH